MQLMPPNGSAAASVSGSTVRESFQPSDGGVVLSTILLKASFFWTIAAGTASTLTTLAAGTEALHCCIRQSHYTSAEQRSCAQSSLERLSIGPRPSDRPRPSRSAPTMACDGNPLRSFWRNV